MKKVKLPVVEGKITVDDCISVGSDEWYKWLEANKSFNYEPIQTERFSLVSAATVRNRSANYWYAYRKVNNKQRQVYLGKTVDLTYEKLQDAAIELSLNDTEYYKLLTNRKRVVQEKKEAKKNQVVQPCLITTEVVQDYFDSMYTSQQATELAAEVEALKSELEAMRQQLEVLEAIRTERDELKLWQETYKPYLVEHRELKKKLELIAQKLHKKEYPRTNHAQLKRDILELVETSNDNGAELEE